MAANDAAKAAANMHLLEQLRMAQERVALVQAAPSVQETLTEFEKLKINGIIYKFNSERNPSDLASDIFELLCNESTKHPTLIARRFFKTLDAKTGTPQYHELLRHIKDNLPNIPEEKRRIPLNNIIQFFTTMQEESQGSLMNGVSDMEIITIAKDLLPPQSYGKAPSKPRCQYGIKCYRKHNPQHMKEYAHGGTRRTRRKGKGRKHTKRRRTNRPF